MNRHLCKKAVALGLVLGLMLSLAACNKEKEDELDLDPGEKFESGDIYIDGKVKSDGKLDPGKVGGKLDRPNQKDADRDHGGKLSAGYDTYAKAVDAFADEKNVMFSPVSLDFALGMAYEAATGDAADALEGYFGKSAEDYRDGVRQYMSGLPDGVSIANGVFVHDEWTLVPETCSALVDGYSAGVDAFDFRAPGAERIVNEWCSEKTNGMIPSILNDVSQLDAVLVNALYFKQDWVEVVPDDAVYDGTFTCADGTEATVDMMHFTVDGHLKNDVADAFVKYYEGGRYGFIGILPVAEGDFRMADLDIGSLVDGESLSGETVVSMPEFGFDNTLPLTGFLQSVGLGSLFGDGSLSRLINESTSHVDEVLQKTKVDVNRQGTEAAAVTAVTVKNDAIAMVDEVFRMELDRPFAFVIYDFEAGMPLFMGKVTALGE